MHEHIVRVSKRVKMQKKKKKKKKKNESSRRAPVVEIVRNHFDSIIWLKLNKQYFGLDQDTYIAGVYIWGDNSPAYNVVDVDSFSLLQDDINDFQSLGAIILCGDWNARVGNGSRPDFIVCDRIVDDIDIELYVPDVPLARHSLDHVCNAHGLKLLDLYVALHQCG